VTPATTLVRVVRAHMPKRFPAVSTSEGCPRAWPFLACEQERTELDCPEGSLMKSIVVLAVALTSLSASVAAEQTELGGKVRSGQEVTIPAGETVQGDLIASGGTVRIDGRVNGDVTAWAGRVIVGGTITGDLLAGAGSTTIAGDVGGDVRAGTGQARIEGRVGEDVLLGTGQATVASGAQIGGDLIFGAGRIQMDGAVAGSVLGSTRSHTGDGTVGGSERINVGQPAEEQPTLADRTVDALRRYVSILVIGVLLLWLFPRLLRGAADTVRARPLVSFGAGILGVIAASVALAVLILVTVLVAAGLGLLGLGSLTAVTIFGGFLVAAVAVFLAVLMVAFAAQAIVGLMVGRLLFRSDGSFLNWLGALALGVLVVALVAAIPVVGGWLEALVALLGVGALLLTARRVRRRVAVPVG
jgi:cytoskeletal protein CcmA (bactofilin family)